MNENNCAICLSELNENDNIYDLNCNHKFHTNCIVDWFRSSSGNCPLCNDNPFNNDDNNNNNLVNEYFLSSTYIDNRFKAIKRYSNNKKSPESLKKEIIKFNEFNKDYIIVNKKMKEFEKNKDYKELQKLARDNRKENWKHYRKVKKQKEKVVSLFPNLYAIN